MKNLDTDAMCNAIKNVLSLCGIDVLADASRFQAAIRDFMFSNSLNTEQQLLIFAIRIGIGDELLKAVKKSVSEQKRILIIADAILTVEYGFLKSRSDSILEAFGSALGWDKATISKVIKPVPNAPKQKSAIEKDKHIVDDGDLAKGSTLQFGRYKWRVLFVKGKTALLLADEITDIGIPYNKVFGEVSWEDSWIREWLNTEFLRRFSKTQRGKILPRNVRAEPNPWYHTDAGSQTNDKVFLLSISEVVRNFGDSGQLKHRNEKLRVEGTSSDDLSCAIDDKFNSERKAMYKDESTWWWLRSPGDSKEKAAYVNAEGLILMNGDLVADDGGTSCVGVRPGVRPAIWIRQ